VTKPTLVTLALSEYLTQNTNTPSLHYTGQNQ